MREDYSNHLSKTGQATATSLFVTKGYSWITALLSLICCNSNLSELLKAKIYMEKKGLPLSKERTYITYHFIECLERRLFVIMVDTSISMQNRDTFFFCTFAVTSIHTVVRPVVPLTWKHVETLCQCQLGDWEEKKEKEKKRHIKWVTT